MAPRGLTPVHLILYDGVCGFCGQAIEAVQRLDRAGQFRYEPLQSEAAERELARHGLDPVGFETAFVVAFPGTSRVAVLDRSSAVLFVAARLGWPWKAAALLWAVPKPLRDWCYDRFARNRFGFGGGADSCRLPTPTPGNGARDASDMVSDGKRTDNPVA